jgi:hypothetical protein
MATGRSGRHGRLPPVHGVCGTSNLAIGVGYISRLGDAVEDEVQPLEPVRNRHHTQWSTGLTHDAAWPPDLDASLLSWGGADAEPSVLS